MKDFLNTYADILQMNHEQVGQVHIDFKRQCLDMTVDRLLEQFVQSKYTGLERPGNQRSINNEIHNHDENIHNTPGIVVYDELLTSIAELANPGQNHSGIAADGTGNNTTSSSVLTIIKEATTTTAVAATMTTTTTATATTTTKGTNGETGVAGNKQNTKKNMNAMGGCEWDGKRDNNMRIKEKDKETITKGSRRTTSLLNLFMSNSQGRFIQKKKNVRNSKSHQ